MVKEWPMFPIGEILDFKNGLNKGKEFFGFGTPIVNYTDVYHNSGIKAEDVKGKVSLSKEEIRRFEVRKNDVFFTRTSETPEEVGLSAVLLEDIQDCVFSGFVLRGRPKNDRLVGEYCKYCFSTKHVREEIIKNCTYTTRALTNGKVLSAIEIPVPVKEEQTEIAVVLSSFEQYIDDLAELIEKKKGIRKGALEDLVSGRTRLAGFCGEWTESKLLEHVNLVQGLTYAPENVKPSGVLVLRSSNIQNGRLSLLDNVYVNVNVPEEKMIQPGDILVCVRNGSSALIGKSCILPRLNNTTFGAFMSVLRGDKTGFFAKLFESDIVQEQVRGRSNATINQITKKDFQSIIVTVPPEPEQKAIASTLNAMDEEIEVLETERDKMIQIREGVMDDLLTGRVRLTK